MSTCAAASVSPGRSHSTARALDGEGAQFMTDANRLAMHRGLKDLYFDRSPTTHEFAMKRRRGFAGRFGTCRVRLSSW